MNKIYLLLMLLASTHFLSAQYESFRSPENCVKKSEQFENFSPKLRQPSFVRKSAQSAYGTNIGTTTYDLQSNYGVGNSRIVRYDDGAIAALWTQSLDANGGHPDRGTGYNYYNPGTQSWGQGQTGQFGLSTLRTGWPQLVQLSAGELALQHDFGGGSVNTNSRTSRGSGLWSASQSVGFSGVWPRAVAWGDTVHMISVDNTPGYTVNGIEIPMEYHRSDDGGQTWSISKFSNFPNYDTSTFWFANIGADIYAIDAYKNHVSIVVGGSWDALILYKSDNYGEAGSWTLTEIYRPDSAYSFVDTTSFLYIVPTVSSEVSVVIDDNGITHVSTTGFGVRWDFGQPKPQDPNGDRFFYPLTCLGLYYWNDTMPTMDYVVNEFVTDAPPPAGNVWEPVASFYDYTMDSVYNAPGTRDSIGDYNGGVGGHTSIAIDNNDGVFIVWSQVAEATFSLFDNYHRDLYMVYSFDNGASWSDIESVALFELLDDGITGGSVGEEDVYPSTIKRVGSDDLLHMVFQTDLEAGVHVQGDMHAITQNEIIYFPIDINPLRPVSISDAFEKADKINVFPNPAHDFVRITCEKKIEMPQVSLADALGKMVPVKMKTLDSRYIDLDLRNTDPGLYFLRYRDGDYEETKKIVIE
jgi:hypothetical protein